MRYFFSFLLIACFLKSQAQSGHYYLSHYSPGDKRIDHVSFDMVQDENGILLFATRSGVLTYDGKNWDLVPCNGAVYAIEINLTGDIFWAGANGFGKIVKDKFGRVASTVLSGNNRNVYQAVAVDRRVYFMNDEAVFIYEEGSGLKAINSDDQTGTFTALYEIFGVPYISTDDGYNFKVNEEKLEPSPFHIGRSSEIFFSCGSGDKYLLGTADNRLFLCSDGFALKELDFRKSDYIKASVIVHGVWLDDNRIALGTLRGGVIIIDSETGSTEEIINYNTGLPDNEIFALITDKDENIWVSHEYGFTCIAPNVPFRSYSHYDNLAGNLLCAISVNEEVYVGTSLGLFKLAKEEIYDEFVYYVNIPVRRPLNQEVPRTKENATETKADEEIADDTKKEPVKKKRGFLRFLKRNRGSIEDVAEKDIQTNAPVIDQSVLDFRSQVKKEEIVFQRLKRTEKVLRSANFIYKKVDGIDAKVTHLAITGNKLIASGLGGMFEIDNLKAKPILEEPVRFFLAADDTTLIATTYSDKVRTLRDDGTTWVMTTDLSEDQIVSVFAGLSGELWLCGIDKIYHFERDISEFVPVDFENPNFSKTVGILLKEEIMFVNANGFYHFDRSESAIIKIDSLPKPRSYFSSIEGIWYHNGHHWSILGKDGKLRDGYMLNLCGDIRYISSDPTNKNLWVINDANELYRFDANVISSTYKTFPLSLKTILQNDVPLTWKNRIVINQEDGPITFEFVQANFTGGSQLEYRYYLQGISETWSEWSSQHDRINIPYLPQGNYSMRVQSRDVFGTISEIELLQFQIQPPYWKTPWFYAMEFTVFALLVLLSFKLSIRYRFISRVLSLLTIILLIEFIQTIIGFSFFTNSSPVIDFIIQVIIAMIILPVEGFLRTLMFKTMGSNSRLLDVIADLDRQQRNKT